MADKDNVQEFLKRAGEQRRSQGTPEQQARRAEVDARNKRLQEVGVKQPASGVFGRVKAERS